MNTYENKFDLMMQELLKQQQVFEGVVTQNKHQYQRIRVMRWYCQIVVALCSIGGGLLLGWGLNSGGTLSGITFTLGLFLFVGAIFAFIGTIEVEQGTSAHPWVQTKTLPRERLMQRKTRTSTPQQTLAQEFARKAPVERRWHRKEAETVLERETDTEGFQRPWSWRAANTRVALSTSVEQTMVVEKPTVHEQLEYAEGTTSGAHKAQERFIPPMLCLKTKPMQALSIEATTDVSLSQQPQGLRGIAKVFLQAVAQEALPTTEEVRILPVEEVNTQPSIAAVERGEERPVPAIETHSKEERGSGVCEHGQCDVLVSNPEVRASSVVMVMLLKNPGHVVVQYISVLPNRGFTIHLSAPVTQVTPFNYIIL
ncbi:MAG: hypothetical protein NVS4B1_34260 [Ktedonobacteraceae bacterium]